MLIELWAILIPIVFIFSYISIFDKQIKNESKENIVIQKAVYSYFIEGNCLNTVQCGNETIEYKNKKIYLRKPKGGLRTDENSKENENAFSDIIDGIEEKIEDNSVGKTSSNI